MVRRILHFELEMPNWEGINSFSKPVLLMIKQAVVKMGEDFIGHRNDLKSMGMDRWIPSSCIGDAREWSDWLLSADMGDFSITWSYSDMVSMQSPTIIITECCQCCQQ